VEFFVKSASRNPNPAMAFPEVWAKLRPATDSYCLNGTPTAIPLEMQGTYERRRALLTPRIVVFPRTTQRLKIIQSP
jgi:hypothetical protein